MYRHLANRRWRCITWFFLYANVYYVVEEREWWAIGRNQVGLPCWQTRKEGEIIPRQILAQLVGSLDGNQ